MKNRFSKLALLPMETKMETKRKDRLNDQIAHDKWGIICFFPKDNYYCKRKNTYLFYIVTLSLWTDERVTKIIIKMRSFFSRKRKYIHKWNKSANIS